MGVGTVLTMLPGLISGVATVAEIAGISVQAAWWWIVVILAVVIALVAIVIKLAEAWKKASDEAQLEQMNKSLEKLTEAADQAKEKFEELTDARKDLDDMANKLKNLTKGTREWREALIETNSKVLELIGTYPELAKYIEKGESGELAISDEGWDKMLDEQM
jgi:flagellar motility protein MotE (MotC chaperone)